MRIKKLEMKNFRGFEELTVQLPDKGSAVFVGVNGAGKSSVLECLKTLFDTLIWDDNKFNYPIGFNPYDIKLGVKSTKNSIELDFENKIYINTSELVVAEIGGWKCNNDSWSELLKDLQKNLKDKSDSNIPISLYYPTERVANLDPSLDIQDLNFESQMDALFSAYGHNFDVFFKWFKNIEDLENEIRLDDNPNYRDEKLEVVRKAITTFLPEFSSIRVRRRGITEFVAKKNDEWLSLGTLSHGERLILAMIGDIARRLSVANPSLENPLEGEGIILIDEIELHLHPKWQRTIVPRLEKTFPNIQFILTTHSPQVLSSMKRDNVFILENFKLVQNTPHTFGKDSNSILYDLFGVTERPDEVKKEFKKLYRLIDDVSKVEEAKVEYEKMKNKYGEFDPEIVRAGMHFDFLENS